MYSASPITSVCCRVCVWIVFKLTTYLYSVSCPQKKTWYWLCSPSLFLIPSFPSALTFLFTVLSAFRSPVLHSIIHFVRVCVFYREWGKNTDKRKDRKRWSRNWRQWNKSLRCTEHKIKRDPSSFLQRKISFCMNVFFFLLGAGCLFLCFRFY